MPDYQDETTRNRRRNPRIDTDFPCFVQFRSFEAKLFENAPRISVKLLNVSADGVLFESEKELPIYPFSTWQFTADINGRELTFNGCLVRKSKSGSRYLIGAEVVPFNPHANNLSSFWNELYAEMNSQ